MKRGNAARAWALVRFAVTACVLMLVWFVFTSSLEPLSLLAGAAGSVLIAALTYREFLALHDATWRAFVPRPFALAVFLVAWIGLVYKASWTMLKAVIAGKANPRIAHFRTRLRSDLARMALCNAVTLTPGTITLDLDEDHVVAHWLFSDTTHARAAGEEIKGDLERLIGRIWQ